MQMRFLLHLKDAFSTLASLRKTDMAKMRLKRFGLQDLKVTKDAVICGIYFLYLNGELLYVGKSTHVILRIRAGHLQAKDFNSWSYFKCAEEELSDFEAKMVVTLKPKLNYRMPNNSRYLSHAWYKTQYWECKAYIAFILSMCKPIACIYGSYIYDNTQVLKLADRYKHVKVKYSRYQL